MREAAGATRHRSGKLFFISRVHPKTAVKSVLNTQTSNTAVYIVTKSYELHHCVCCVRTWLAVRGVYSQHHEPREQQLLYDLTWASHLATPTATCVTLP